MQYTGAFTGSYIIKISNIWLLQSGAKKFVDFVNCKNGKAFTRKHLPFMGVAFKKQHKSAVDLSTELFS